MKSTINGRDYYCEFPYFLSNIVELTHQVNGAHRDMASLLNFRLLSAMTLGTFALCPSAAPLVSGGSPSAEPPSGGPEEPLLCQSPVWDVFIQSTKHHRKQFEEEFSNEANYDFLERTEVPSPPAGCPTNISKEACLLRLAQGLQVYKVLLTHVKTEYPDNSLLPHIKYNSDLLIKLIKGKMRHPARASALGAAEAQSVLQGLQNPNTFLRRLTAHSVLRKLHLFLIDGNRDLARKELRGRRGGCSVM